MSTMTNIPETLVAAVERQRAILFAGAGLSCSLGLPLFDVLTNYLAEELQMKHLKNIDFQVLAEYYFLRTKDKSKLYEWMRNTWHPPDVRIGESRAHNAIVDLNFPVIYTTNYDSWIERSFCERGKPFRKIVKVSDFAETKNGETEIIKFHGDFDDPATIVITESHFLRRLSLGEPLDIRLRSDSLARPILFVGYSLSDPNIRYLLYRLHQLWAEYSDENIRPKSYILMLDRDEVQERLLRERGLEPIVWAEEDASAALTSFFDALCDSVNRREPAAA